MTITSSNAAALTALGLAGGVKQARTQVPGVLEGKTLTIGATGGGIATNITFGTGAGHVSTLTAERCARRQQPAGHDRDRQAEHHHHERSGFFHDRYDRRYRGWRQPGVRCRHHGSGSGCRRIGQADPRQPGRPVQQHHQADHHHAQDASFNGVNLLGGDTLKLAFNETGKSTLNIPGVNFNPAGLGLDA